MTAEAWKPFVPPGPFPKWPSRRYGPDGQNALFDKPEDVPPGWAESPDKARTEAARAFAQQHYGHTEDLENSAMPAPNNIPTTSIAIPRKLTLKRRAQTSE